MPFQKSKWHVMACGNLLVASDARPEGHPSVWAPLDRTFSRCSLHKTYCLERVSGSRARSWRVADGLRHEHRVHGRTQSRAGPQGPNGDGGWSAVLSRAYASRSRGLASDYSALAWAHAKGPRTVMIKRSAGAERVPPRSQALHASLRSSYRCHRTAGSKRAVEGKRLCLPYRTRRSAERVVGASNDSSTGRTTTESETEHPAMTINNQDEKLLSTDEVARYIGALAKHYRSPHGGP